MGHTRLVAAVAAGALATTLAAGSVGAATLVQFARNAGHVNGIVASRTPRPGALVPLRSDGRFSPAVIPQRTVLGAGQTVTGVIGGSVAATAAGQQLSATASLFPAAPRSIVAATVGIDATATENAACNGTVDAPSAPPGTLCIYLATDQLAGVAQDCNPGPFPNCNAGDGSYAVAYQPVNNAEHGFAVTWTARAAGVTTLYATWAYTAPQ
jgi:hypothetical protein